MISLRPYQQEAIDNTYAWMRSNIGNPLIVLPTGSGKSLVAAKITEDALQWPNQRVLQLTHVQELVEQNFKQLIRLWPEAPAGIYCASLDRKQHHHAITVASIQSVRDKAELIGWRDLIMIDEAHLLGDDADSMYRKFLDHQRAINPEVVVVGLSATPYRLKSGYLHEGKGALFNGVAYDLPVGRLVREGYLAPLVNKAANTQGRTDHLGLQAGEFALKEAITEFDRTEMTKAAVNEMLELAYDRKKWLIFCVSIEHAEHIMEELNGRGVDTAMVSAKTPKGERDKIKNDFDKGLIRAVVNVAVWTTGLDIVGIDLIVLLRPTMSPGLLVQMLGRGMRPVYAPGTDMTTVEGRLAGIAAGGKPNCLVMDMASNLERHGPITHIQPPSGCRKDKKDRQGKVCFKCRTVNELTATECADCGSPFGNGGAPRIIKHTLKAAPDQVMSDEPKVGDVPVWLNVKKIDFFVHQKIGSPDSLRVTYNCSPNYVSEYIGFQHSKEFVRRKAADWWLSRGGRAPVPETAAEGFERLDEICGFRPRRVRVFKNGKYTNVTAADLIRQATEIHKDTGNLGRNSATQIVKESTDADNI